MPIQSRKSRKAVQGSALLITLTMIVLITVVILVFTVQTQLERQLSSTQFSDQRSQGFTQMGFDTALTRIRETLHPFDDPFGNTNTPATFWSLSPGRIDLFALTNGHAQPRRVNSVPLHSGYPVTNMTPPLANLNAPDSFGNRPIIPNLEMEVEWMPVGKNPSAPLSNTNAMEGRFAFWVDDEGSKINVNTADGSDNYTLSSYGQGTPSAVSLSVFRDLGDTNAPNRTAVRQIAAQARRSPFATVTDMGKRSALTNVVSPKFLATHAFNLTTFSRSPDFNIFNLPKFQLVPTSTTHISQMTNSDIADWRIHTTVDRRHQYFGHDGFFWVDANFGGWAAASHLRSVYPAPPQLSGTFAATWPVMAADNRPGGVIGFQYYNLLANSVYLPANTSVPGTNYWGRLNVAVRTADYLIGRNILGQTIRWPFLNPNYSTKYNRRQIDSITLQILELARGAGDGLEGDFYAKNSAGIPHTATIAPVGLSSGSSKPVMSASGRYPRLTRAMAEVVVFERPDAFPMTNASNYYPGIQVYTNSTNLPTGKKLGDPIVGTPGLYDGVGVQIRFAVSLYLPRYLYESDNFVGQVSLNNTLPATLIGNGHALVDSTTLSWGNQQPFGWRPDNNGPGYLNETDRSFMVNPITSNWMDYLVSADVSYDGENFDESVPNSSGLDFLGRGQAHQDTDSRAASMRRREYKAFNYKTVSGNPAVTNTHTPSGYHIWGTGPDIHNGRPVWEYSVGQNFSSSPVAGLFSNHSLDSAGMPRKTRNLTPTNIVKLRFKGGITFRLNHHGHAGMVAPVDQISGPLFPGNWTQAPVRLDGTNRAIWRERAKHAVIPVFRGTNQANGQYSTNGVEIAVGQTLYVLSKPRDPLLGQLPGDWVTQTYTNAANLPTNSAARRVFNNWPDVVRGVHGFHSDQNRNPGNYDYLPEPEWVDMAADAGSMNIEVGGPAESSQDELLRPYEENGVQKINVVRISSNSQWKKRLLNISKQRALPSVGQLQYLRTGAMPDRFAANLGDYDYAGMPFRCLNFGPANTQAGIPDWALLDLFTVPNAIWTQPASRLAYPRLTTWAGAERPELIHLTYGGASSGKINLNGSVLWPWGESSAVYVRPLPLAAQFNGLRFNTNGIVRRDEFAPPLNVGGNAPQGLSYLGNLGQNINRMSVRTQTNSWNVLQPTQARQLAETIAEYIRVNGPLSMPGQMCNVLPGTNGIGITTYGAQIPTTYPTNSARSLLPPFQNGSLRNPSSDHFYAANVHSGGTNRTRNDIVSQSIGNLVTQGNVFAIWVIGQSIQKSPNSDPEIFEPDKGDKIAGQTRLRFLVERKLDPGVDGVYGNSKPKVGSVDLGPAGLDQTIGTPDDLVDPLYHPPNPKFIYEVVNVQEVL